jgi:hypothetical protein
MGLPNLAYIQYLIIFTKHCERRSFDLIFTPQEKNLGSVVEIINMQIILQDLLQKIHLKP